MLQCAAIIADTFERLHIKLAHTNSFLCKIQKLQPSSIYFFSPLSRCFYDNFLIIRVWKTNTNILWRSRSWQYKLLSDFVILLYFLVFVFYNLNFSINLSKHSIRGLYVRFHYCFKINFRLLFGVALVKVNIQILFCTKT